MKKNHATRRKLKQLQNRAKAYMYYFFVLWEWNSVNLAVLINVVVLLKAYLISVYQ